MTHDTTRHDVEAALNRKAFDDVVTFLYNSQHTDLGFPKEKAIRAAIYAKSLESRLAAQDEVVEAARTFADAWDESEAMMEDLREQRREYGSDHPTIAPMQTMLREAAADEREKKDAFHAALARLDQREGEQS